MYRGPPARRAECVTADTPEQTAASCQHVVDMLTAMQRYPDQGGPEVMELDKYWHPHFSWYGPSGIGSSRGVDGFRRWHQTPFLNAMPTGVTILKLHFFAEGPYVAVTGWLNMAQTLTSGGWLGIALTQQKITLRSLDFWRLEDGLIRENWVLVDLLDVWAQLGVDVLARMTQLASAWPGYHGVCSEGGSRMTGAGRTSPSLPKRQAASGRITSSDVARLAGVSQSAVSRVFTDGASASAKTSAKVRDAAEQLGYRPNRLARSLLTGKSYMVGLVVAYLDNYFYPEVLEKLSKALQQQGYHVLIFMAAQTADNIDDVIEEILEYQVDAIVTASVALSSELADRCQSAGIPIVQFNRVQEQSRFSSVTTDNYKGGTEVACHLIAQGYTSFGYIAGWEGASTQRDREAGFRAGLADHGFDLGFRAVGNFRTEQAYQAAQMLLSANDRPEAVFVANDAMALVVMDVVRHHSRAARA